MLSEEDAAKVDMNRVENMTEKASNITVYAPLFNRIKRSSIKVTFIKLLCCFWCQTLHTAAATYIQFLLIPPRQKVIWAKQYSRPCQVPPEWPGGYGSIYATQAGADK